MSRIPIKFRIASVCSSIQLQAILQQQVKKICATRTKMLSVHWLSVALLLAAAVSTQAYPWSRQKRVSDQRLAELETLLTLARLKGKLVTVPIGYGLIDPAKIGRRKRSEGSTSAVHFEFPRLEMVSLLDDVTSEERGLTPSARLRRDLEDSSLEKEEDIQRTLRTFQRKSSSQLQHENR